MGATPYRESSTHAPSSEVSRLAHDRDVRPSWSPPRLVVLARSSTEERVLLGCKGNSVPTSFLEHYAGCHSDAPACTTLCSSQTTS